MEIPYDNGRILFERDSVSRGYAAESGNALAIQAAYLFVNRIIIHVIKETCCNPIATACGAFPIAIVIAMPSRSVTA